MWSLSFQGEHKTLRMLEELKTLGFRYATSAGVSLSIDDLSIPPKKRTEILDAQALILQSSQGRAQGNRTAVEELQNVVDTWHRTSEAVKDHVIDYFEATNILNPVYMMAFSGARGNVSQVRQLVGMRGLMADPKGDIIGYAIRSNFREGLTITEYMISAYGARKGVVDTALRTADAGYLTRRLVDVAQHITVQQESCGTDRGVRIRPIIDGGKVILGTADRLIGRILARDVYSGEQKLASRNESIDHDLANEISNTSEVHSGPDLDAGPEGEKTKLETSPDSVLHDRGKWLRRALVDAIVADGLEYTRKEGRVPRSTQSIADSMESIVEKLSAKEVKKGLSAKEMKPETKPETKPLKAGVYVRSPLTCDLNHGVCQLCYGWSFAQNRLVPLGEAVGVMAGQSIGEPGTQLTMRTFHTGGVFTGEVQDQFRAPHGGIIHYPQPFSGLLVRTPYGQIGFLVRKSGTLIIRDESADRVASLRVPAHTALFLREGEKVHFNQILGLVGGRDGQVNDRVETRKSVLSAFAGEVCFEGRDNDDTAFPEKPSARRKRLEAEEIRELRRKKLTSAGREKEAYRLRRECQETDDAGTMWVLAGRSVGPLVEEEQEKLLPRVKKSGHFVSAGTPFTFRRRIMPTAGFIVRAEEQSPVKKKPRMLSPEVRSRLTQEINEKVQVASTEAAGLAPMNRVRLHQPQIYSPCTKLVFDFLRDRLAIKANNGDVFLIRNYTKQIHEQVPARPRDLSIGYFQAESRVGGPGAFFWQQPLFSNSANTQGLCFVTSQATKKSLRAGFCGKTVLDAWTSPGSSTDQFASQRVKAAKGRRRTNLKPFPWQNDDQSISVTKKKRHLDATVDMTEMGPPTPSAGIAPKGYSKVETFYCPVDGTLGLESNFQGQLLTAGKAGMYTRGVVDETSKISWTSPIIHELCSSDGPGQTRQRNPRENSHAVVQGVGSDVRLQFPFCHEGQTTPTNDLSTEPGWFYLPGHPVFGSAQTRPQFHGRRVTSKALVVTSEYLQVSLQYAKTVDGLAQKVGIARRSSTRPEEREGLTAKRPKLHNARRLSILRHPRLLSLIATQTEKGLMRETVGTSIAISYPKNPWYLVFGTEESRLSEIQGRFMGCQFGYTFSPLMASRAPAQKWPLMARLKQHLSKRSPKALHSPGLLYQTLRELSLDRIVHTVNRFEQSHNFELAPMTSQQPLMLPLRRNELSPHSSLYQAFQSEYNESADKPPTVMVKKTVTRAVWSKQMLFESGVGVAVATPRPPSMKVVLLPNLSHLHRPGFVCHFEMRCKPDHGTNKGVGAWELAFIPPWCKSVEEATEPSMTISFAKSSSLYYYPDTPESEGKDGDVITSPPPATWLPYDVPVSILKGVDAEGVVIYRPKTRGCVLVGKDDKQTFAFSKPMTTTKVIIGEFVRLGDEIETGVGIPAAGEVIAMTPTTITIRKGQPVLFTNSGSACVEDMECISKSRPLITLSYQRLITGDIVQGIPKVEQLFEGAKSEGKEGSVSLARQLVGLHRYLMDVKQVPEDRAFHDTMRMAQDKLVENIQKVYLSQGVHLADIHFEVIVRRITSWGKVRLSRDSGLFRHEVMPLHRLEKVNDGIDGEKALFIPTIVGITAAARNSESFLSAASFQESSRVLARDVLAGKTDFLRGIKERVILGDLIPAGTGFKEHIAYAAKPPKVGAEL